MHQDNDFLIDTNILAHYCRNNTKLMCELLAVFNRQIAAYQEKMHTTQLSGEELDFLLHTIQGSAMTVGAIDLGHLAKTIERQTAQGIKQDNHTIQERLSEAIQQTLLSLEKAKTHITQNSASKSD